MPRERSASIRSPSTDNTHPDGRQAPRLCPAAFLKQKSDLRRLALQARAEARRSSIKARDEESASKREEAEYKADTRPARKSKYSKQNVLLLKQVFDSYDKNGDGQIQRSELELALANLKQEAQRYDGRVKTLEERQQAAGIVSGKPLSQRGCAENVFLVDCCSAMFNVLDDDGSGSISFRELLQICFPRANDEDMRAMMNFVAPIDETADVQYEMPEETRVQIKQLFRLYDKDGSGNISWKELAEALETCGLSPEELDSIFNEKDTNSDGQLDEAEFVALMESTGVFEEELPGFVRKDERRSEKSGRGSQRDSASLRNSIA